MSVETKPGCLAAIFGSSRATSSPSTPAPQYRLRADFLSRAEMTFFLNLEAATRGRFLVFTKVNLGDLLFSPTHNVADRNRIDRKHLDFLLCDATSLRPVLGVELDDSSHQRGKAAERDAVKDAALRSAGLPLLRLPGRSYTAAEITQAIDGAVRPASDDASSAVTSVSSVPMCPSCRIPMVLRPAVAGRHAAFYGCQNFPRCRQTAPA